MQIWQVGLDIQENGFYALAVQRQRYGWQLRHWCFQPVYSTQSQVMMPVISAEMIPLLRQWRRKLPKRISVRIALPASSILQQSIPLPEQKLSRQEQSWLVDASLSKLFPLAAKELAIDYRVVNSINSAYLMTEKPEQPDEIVVSAARRAEVQQWLGALAQADIFPEIIDTVPCVLRAMAESAGVVQNDLLFHQLTRQFLLVSSAKQPFFYRLQPNEMMNSVERIASAIQIYQQVSGVIAAQVGYSGLDSDMPLPPNVNRWSPLAALQQLSAPLPDSPHQFVLACGLALRQEDNDASG
ncbi:MAG: pilus assembly protein PilM [Enterobacteriaceae bacterium]|jgi:pilus assembly protein HofM|nr:pilus assembly protein PilM [Enterobacteriaceae bacterium]